MADADHDSGHADRRVRGFCPMGCGETLFLGSGGYVTCGYLRCPQPAAAADILGTRETEHLANLTDQGFSIIHPLRERLDEALLTECPLHNYVQALDGPPRQPGVYRVTPDGLGWRWLPRPQTGSCGAQS